MLQNTISRQSALQAGEFCLALNVQRDGCTVLAQHREGGGYIPSRS